MCSFSFAENGQQSKYLPSAVSLNLSFHRFSIRKKPTLHRKEKKNDTTFYRLHLDPFTAKNRISFCPAHASVLSKGGSVDIVMSL